MAALSSLSRSSSAFSRLFRNVARVFSPDFRANRSPRLWRGARLLAVASISFLVARKYLGVNTVHAYRARKRDDELQKAVRLTTRERRFIKFASVEYDGQVYMTPQDFLDSVIESDPRPRLKRRVLTSNDLEAMKKSTPSLRHGSPHMFRNLRDRGIISYTEYLFLLSILTKPQTGFRIAFNMFDTDGNERVDKTEFLVLRTLLSPSDEGLASRAKLRVAEAPEKDEIVSNSYMEKIFSHAWRDRHGGDCKDDLTTYHKSPEDFQAHFKDDQGLQRRHSVDTTLMLHFFGQDGSNELKYEGFKLFMQNLQYEVLELEFHEYSKGQNVITELDFAKILLRYTHLDTDEYDKYLDRLLDRNDAPTGITFEEFRVFYQFLNNLDDFSIAMRMYTLADYPISKDEFQRAVKICTGTYLSRHIIDTVFAIFDVDGDGQLSYKEFIAIMKNRLHRGFQSQQRRQGYAAFKNCVKQEMKAP
ncbi:calcium uptake protein 3, mitochondrial isoform X2 [Orussus abietinus]|uniref:calcium uptake protein 3, mitochondrial isoform X2 n=1 Tax=Orussus abietinus TaxID=222816 RepID=UPI0006269D83|nr:calcium uptake protein 3, mitochondrial isoform X2 [Orussus abietinus]